MFKRAPNIINSKKITGYSLWHQISVQYLYNVLLWDCDSTIQTNVDPHLVLQDKASWMYAEEYFLHYCSNEANVLWLLVCVCCSSLSRGHGWRPSGTLTGDRHVCRWLSSARFLSPCHLFSSVSLFWLPDWYMCVNPSKKIPVEYPRLCCFLPEVTTSPLLFPANPWTLSPLLFALLPSHPPWVSTPGDLN